MTSSKKKIIYSIGAVIIIIVIIIISKISISSPNSDIQTPPASEKVTLAPLHVPEGWETYTNEEWGIALAYPSNWNTRNTYSPLDQEYLSSVYIEGDGYEIHFSNRSGTGLPTGMKTLEPPYTIGGFTAKSWQREIGGHYEQIFVANGFQFWVFTPNKSKELSDQILSTIQFGE